MSVKRFLGPNKRDVMRQVRTALGPEAMILSSRHIDDGVEILAMADEALSALEAQATPAPTTQPEGDFSALANRLLAEVQEMRSLIHQGSQTAPVKSSVPAASPLEQTQNELVRWAQAAGFSSALTKNLLNAAKQEQESVVDFIRSQLQGLIKTPENPVDLFSEGGVLALVGPTGVGKTTTTAKLAAHYVMQFGPEGLLLVTTDSYRIGAQEQLRIYAELLGVEMVALGEDDSLETLTPKLRNKRLVLIDTVGMSQRDQRLTQRIGQLRLAQGANSLTRLVLLLNGASQRDTLYEVVERFRAVAADNGHRIHDCIVTKKDEAAQLGAAIDTLIQHDLTLHFVSYGQRVPEDMELANQETLVDALLDSTQRRLAEQEEFQSLYQTQLTPASAEQPHRMNTSKVSAGFQKIYGALHTQCPSFSVLERAHDACQQQGSEREALLAETHKVAKQRLNDIDVAGITWPKSTPVARCKWHLPPLPIANAGQLLGIPIVTDFSHQGMDDVAMHELEHVHMASYHLCSALPSLTQRQGLERPWVAVINRNHRVTFEGKAMAALKLQGRMHKQHLQSLRYRSEPAKLELYQLPVTLPDSNEKFHLWFGLVKSTQRDTVFVRRHWLSPSTQDSSLTIQLLLEQLQVDEIASLARQAVQALAHKLESANHDPALIYCGVVMAGVIVQLDQDVSPAGQALRQQLLAFSGRRGHATSAKLLDALMQLLDARIAATSLQAHIPSVASEAVL
ncbi:flagellar biosynthesis protein FlhF [Aliidiomarina indica]|uniref:flagellar biosynthesis protein FlhF n=1 Tax=Aliidiomarina indica TaxID=2749147 RepID=UPI00188FC19F|nr:flagellar biosynthesis protein FlhF [Aliidiomarina indica]